MEQSDYLGDWIFLSSGTDGRDGSADAAGAIVDGGTPAHIRAAGGEPQALLSNDFLITGAIGTNVADLQIFLCA